MWTCLERQFVPHLEKALKMRSQNEIARASDIPQPTLSNFLKGTRNLGGVGLALLPTTSAWN